ncbi:DUF4007 family protein [candidate division WS5 bacterium]|uniref:DUF4007 family protein n=1 Tax=candidate division WS5 bacterium TaxID=2093353 RepID=A0A419DG75_9BACT|nr:MAG: DUF4007 family protein [candidate division WS5 bacterium]
MISSKTISKTNPIFARHETFHPRFGWLKKGFDKAVENSVVFSEESAPSTLGVGKNMAKAIRYWCLAYKILQEEPNKNRSALVPTDFGRRLLNDDGWDPYLEDTASLWLLHWNLLKVPCQATAWYYVFNIFNRHVFTADDILSGLIEYKDRAFPSININESSLLKDANCLLRMYVEQIGKEGLIEDSIDCPFVELGLIKHYGESKQYAMNIGPKPWLTPAIIVASCLEFAASHAEEAKTISISRLLYDEGSPGLCFKIKENTLCDAIETISMQFDDIALSETAGLIQMSYDKTPVELSERLLKHYYRRRG